MFTPIFKVYVQKLKNVLWHFPKSIFYQLYYGYPSRKLILIGITGTDGKTTTANLIHQVLLQAGIKAGVISTIGAKIGDKEITLGLHTTSPDPAIVQKIFQQMVDEGLTHVVVEVTAHALDQFRFYGCHFQISVMTNISHEHLDDFIDINRYILAKTKLFKVSDYSILNKDDQSFPIISSFINNQYSTYSINNISNYQAKNIVLTSKNMSFSVGKLTFKTDSNYQYQIYNILAAYSVLQKLNIDPSLLISVIKHFPDIKGRREIVKNDFHIRTIIDFAHTPAALETTLKSLRQTTRGKLIVIFGATGGRDPSKRPLMGRVVSLIADIAIITADDTRNELVQDINRQIEMGIDDSRQKSGKFIYYDIPSRQDAFNLAIKLASAGDTVIACGKGHETTILHGKTEYPWSESEAFRTAFRQKNI